MRDVGVEKETLDRANKGPRDTETWKSSDASANGGEQCERKGIRFRPSGIISLFSRSIHGGFSRDKKKERERVIFSFSVGSLCENKRLIRMTCVANFEKRKFEGRRAHFLFSLFLSLTSQLLLFYIIFYFYLEMKHHRYLTKFPSRL
ncbi:hypothetical protein PUN28_004463 [Cardiocondyla obscurior]|uniref:Transmembrane protein n=1 Tax=Cardiocondyla obscurior TaxID=286306 RepID=A0AAW2GDM8_9HYME